MAEPDASSPATPSPSRWPRRARIAAWLLAYASLFGVASIVDTADRKVRASRAELGVIELRHGSGPSGVKGWVATFNIDLPVDQVWVVLRDCRNFPKVLKGVAGCTLLKDEGLVKYHHMTLTHPDNAYMDTRTEYDESQHRTRWRMTQGSFRAAEGGIDLAPHPRHRGWTRVRYAYYLSISALLPESFEIPRIQRSVTRMAREIQDYFTAPAKPRRSEPHRVAPGR
jgi:uncharacterized membrane protein